MRLRPYLVSSSGRAEPRIPPAGQGKPVVARIRTGDDLGNDLARLLALLPRDVLPAGRGMKVLIKPSYNSVDPSPATTDPTFLREAAVLLAGGGAHSVTVAESTGLANPSSIEETSLLLGLRPGEVKSLDLGPWSTVPLPGSPVRKVRVAAEALRAGYLVYLVCLKTHSRARFSLGIKAVFGLIHPRDRVRLHLYRLEERTADLNLAIRPDLILVDGRKAMVTGGPEKGEVVEPGLLFASADMVALDVECLKVLRSYDRENRLDAEPSLLGQISRAAALGIGRAGEGEYEVSGDPL